ncbi:MAG: type II toxin-antitoxin system Phd/YefM family antitoxin [Bifidobacteriaceae bacterium]|nr:type II toxin-antitoxin system Phd/YefM family antitoxin [Bifidobacteriaceae bacterium]
MRVGLRELRADLSNYVRQATGGATVVVTDRGRAIARICPPEGLSTLERWMAEGLVRPASRPREPQRARILTSGTVSDLVAGERG